MKQRMPSGTAHIYLDDSGRAWIDNTNVKVNEVVLDKLGEGLNPEQIFEEHYRRISMAQIHAALSYYYDHQAEFDHEIERQVQEVESLRAQSLDSPGRRKLRALNAQPHSSFPRILEEESGVGGEEQAFPPTPPS
jgi:uncharacterized protein (DUF433 family)